MTDATDAVWKTQRFVPRDVGDAIGRATVELVSGRAEFEFDSGARVAIAGPAALEFLSPLKARLHSGRLTAFVPEPARGFTVEFKGARIVDLGTEFAINSDGQSSTEVHVYDGGIVVHHENACESQLLTLRANDTKKLETGQGSVADALFESERFLRIHRDIRTPQTTGDIRYLNRPPRSVLHGAFEHNQYVLLFRERACLILPRAVEVDADVPGEYRTQRKPEDPPGTAVAVLTKNPGSISLATLSEGTRLDSYFVHFDPVRGGPGGGHRSGSIRFDRPILGGIIATRNLVSTDDFHPPGTVADAAGAAVAGAGRI